MAYYSRPEQVLEHLLELFNEHKGLLGIAYVATQEEALIPEFPAIQVVAEPMARTIHGLQTFQNQFFCSIWIYHANLEASFATRTLEDLALATEVIRLLHKKENRALHKDGEDKVLAPAFVSAEVPGMVNSDQGQNIVTTRLTWQAKTRTNFDDI